MPMEANIRIYSQHAFPHPVTQETVYKSRTRKSRTQKYADTKLRVLDLSRYWRKPACPLVSAEVGHEMYSL